MGQRIYLNNQQSALVLGDDGYQALHVPELKPDDNVPDGMALLTTIAVLLKLDDLDFQEYMAKRWNEIVDQQRSRESQDRTGGGV